MVRGRKRDIEARMEKESEWRNGNENRDNVECGYQTWVRPRIQERRRLLLY